jgi:hypothetical protein
VIVTLERLLFTIDSIDAPVNLLQNNLNHTGVIIVAKLYYAFIGQNATTGKPNTRTGYHSLYGDLYAFISKRERDCFVDSRYNSSSQIIAVATNKRDAKRKYFKGMTQVEFDQYLLYVGNGYNQE